jgi:tRNA (uracil-5-)-methyltransferase
MTSSYQQQLDAKIERITAQFAEFTPPALEVFQSPEKHFRMRAEFRIWHTEDDMFYAMFERDEDNQKKSFVLMTSQSLMPVLISSCLFCWQN